MLKISNQTRSLIRQALREDIGPGDVTTKTFIPSSLMGEAYIEAKEKGILSGGPIVREIFRQVDPRLKVQQKISEGSKISKGKAVFSIHGKIASILKGERVALNFLSHLSGIATLTRHYVEKIKGTRVKILDTRKTTPLLRDLEKYAVRCGGGENHRLGLWDEILVKENHWDAMYDILDQTKCRYFTQRLKPLLKRRRIPVEVEVRSLKELAHLLEGTYVPDRILLDNFSIKELRRAVLFVEGLDQILKARYGIRRKRPFLEASGGIHLGNVREVAKTGVDRISIGRLTHSAPALDFSLHTK
ncbi:MAG: carboxylating nicotinate-nucleotide diphosphorylase [Candidatus Omnitrophica bacterium]|nr:carboxylating nicotinate-nucleotide diphosphorylase [Candidatus Omnitrophota bacterium]